MTLLLHHDKTYPVGRAETQYRSKDWIPIFSLSGSSMGATAGAHRVGNVSDGLMCRAAHNISCKSLTDLCAGLHVIFHVWYPRFFLKNLSYKTSECLYKKTYQEDQLPFLNTVSAGLGLAETNIMHNTIL